MPDNEFMAQDNCFKEAVCIDAMRIYDSCSDKDCIEDTRIYFTADNQAIIDCATSVRIKDVKVISTYLDLQPIPFNRGFYSVDMTFFFEVSVEVFTAPTVCPVTIRGVTMFDKKVILYGSEGSVKVFTSDDDCEKYDFAGSRSVPKAVVQVAEPIALSAKICDCGTRFGCDQRCLIPHHIACHFGGDFDFKPKKNCVYATIGLFIIVQIVRNTQMLIPAYDFCIPEKECITSSDNPCELFKKIDFPVNEFFPPKADDCLTD